MALGDIIQGPGGTGTHSYSGYPDNWQSDNAYDLEAPTGTPVRAAIAGTVTKVGPLTDSTTSRFAGIRVEIDGPSNQVWYGHLSKASVKAGDQVKVGDQIGLSGSANNVQHLHFAALHDPKQYIDSVLGKSGGGNIVTKAAGQAVDAVVDKVTGAATGAAADAAADVAKSAVSAIWDAVGEDGARALLYAVLVFGGTALALAGIARATGVGQLAKDINAKGQEAALLVATKGAV